MSKERSALIRLASTMPKGSAERKALLKTLKSGSLDLTKYRFPPEFSAKRDWSGRYDNEIVWKLVPEKALVYNRYGDPREVDPVDHLSVILKTDDPKDLDRGEAPFTLEVLATTKKNKNKHLNSETFWDGAPTPREFLSFVEMVVNGIV